ncbi:hypothetical protein ACIBG7_39180 [Nonomuraea sp. NPDC050328]|uniref:hypothetical protein n=1 Tax=Nonomuraea sp. NPDC050328 TaxID=3364361 RepID=UPI0037AB1BD3
MGPARPREPRIEHAPPGPTDDRARGLPLASPWGLPPFASPTPEEEPPEAPRGRRPYSSPTAEPETDERRRRLVSRPDKLVATGQARPYPQEAPESPEETERRQRTADTKPYPRQGIPLRRDQPPPAQDPPRNEPVAEEPPPTRPAERAQPYARRDPHEDREERDRRERLNREERERHEHDDPEDRAREDRNREERERHDRERHDRERHDWEGDDWERRDWERRDDREEPPPAVPIPVEPAIDAEPEHVHGDDDQPAVRRVGRPPGGRPTRPDLLVASGPAGAGRHQRGPAPAATRRSSPVRRRRLAAPVAILVAIALTVAGGILAWRQLANRTPDGLSLATGRFLPADTLFELSSAVSGSNQKLNDVATAGQVVVAVGSDTTSPTPRPLFLFSPDAGRTWQLGKVSDSPTATVLKVVGAEGHWLAAGGDEESGVGLWTSTDGFSWESVEVAGLSAFRRGESVRDLARTAEGFVAVGGSPAEPAAWSSPDGRTWQRVELGDLDVRTLEAVEARGDTVVALGRPGQGDGSRAIRSTDGGRTWRATGFLLPEAQPKAGALAVLPKQFVLVSTAPPTPEGHVRVYCSATGEQWGQCGTINGLDRQSAGVDRVVTYGGGVAAISLVGLAGYSVLTSDDAKTWTKRATIGDLGDATLRGFALTPDGTVFGGGDRAASDIDNQPVLMTVPPGGEPARVELGRVQGLTRVAREVARVATGDGWYVAVGSASGEAGIWSSLDGEFWDAHSLGGPRLQALRDVAHGPKGWIAVGGNEVAASVSEPLVISSTDARVWKKTAAPARGQNSVTLHRITAGHNGYVLGGEERNPAGTAAAALWHTRDGQKFAKAKQLPQGGADVRIHDLAAAGERYFAVGGAGRADRESGVLWWSDDGQTWKARPRILPKDATSAGLRQVVAFGDRVVVIGTAVHDGVRKVFSGYSTDGGKTWGDYTWLRAEHPAEVHDLAATESGVVAVGTHNGDGAAWISEDGQSWTRHDPSADQLTGEGRQWLAAVALSGTRVLGLGRSATYNADHLILWTTTLAAE